VIKQSNKTWPSYFEVGQVNPLRWQLLLRDENGDFTPQAGVMKCKDFFNDLVALGKGVPFSIYLFDNSTIKKNDEGYFILVSHLNDREQFFTNLTVLNDRLFSDLGAGARIAATTEGCAANQAILLFPNILWEKTYYISLATWLVRCSNYGYKFSDWSSFFDPASPCVRVDGAVRADNVHQFIKTHGFKLPEAFQQFWWYGGPVHNSEKLSEKEMKQNCTLIHNCGILSWVLGMEKGAVPA
jgi:hypothetical protein